jgi:hypothetical protein
VHLEDIEIKVQIEGSVITRHESGTCWTTTSLEKWLSVEVSKVEK